MLGLMGEWNVRSSFAPNMVGLEVEVMIKDSPGDEPYVAKGLVLGKYGVLIGSELFDFHPKLREFAHPEMEMRVVAWKSS